MVRTLPIARFVLAIAVVIFIATPAWAQRGDADHGHGPLPVYLLARAAHAELAGDAADTALAPDLLGVLDGTGDASPQLPRPAFHIDVVAPEQRPAALPVLYGALVALQAADFYTTNKGLALGAHETNALVRNGNNGTTLALKAASTATTIFIAERMWKKNKAGAIALMLATNVVYGAVVANNARVIGELR